MRVLNFNVPRERRIGLKRLLKLADYLKTVPKKEFDYGEWYHSGPACGTVACALGHAAQMKGLKDPRRCGLKLNLATSGLDGHVSGFVSLGSDNEFTDTAAGARAFGLTHIESEELFVSGCTNTRFSRNPVRVAAKIRKFATQQLKNLDKGMMPVDPYL